MADREVIAATLAAALIQSKTAWTLAQQPGTSGGGLVAQQAVQIYRNVLAELAKLETRR